MFDENLWPITRTWVAGARMRLICFLLRGLVGKALLLEASLSLLGAGVSENRLAVTRVRFLEVKGSIISEEGRKEGTCLCDLAPQSGFELVF